MQKQAARKRTFEVLPKPDIYRSYRHTLNGSLDAAILFDTPSLLIIDDQSVHRAWIKQWREERGEC
jgi:hypothetical protein